MRQVILPILMLCICTSHGVAQAVERAHPAPSPMASSHEYGNLLQPVQEPEGPSLKSRIGRMFTGAVVGGWLGYFASHLVVSDWETRSGITSYRSTWAVGGLALGAVTGQFIAGGGQGPQDLRPGFAAARQVIERDEMIESGGTNAYEVVRSLRKEWLIPRGVNSFRESARGTAGFDEETVVIPGADHIIVYYDNARLGGTQYLVEVGVEPLASIEFISPSAATFRWGTGHAHGVILLTTLGAELTR